MTRTRTLLALLGLIVATLAFVQSPAGAAAPRQWRTVDVGSTAACAIRDTGDGDLYCWGGNDHGQLGIGTTKPKSRPTKVAGSWLRVSVGQHTCGISTSDTLYCWGHNNFGQLGKGDTSERRSPSRVNTNDWATVSVGGQNTCAITRTSRLYCWGYNEYGQVGNGYAADGQDKNDRRTPHRIGTFTKWRKVSVGTYFACGLSTTDKLYCWGSNDEGQLGLGSSGRRSTPTRVGSLDDWATLSAGGASACAVRETKRAFCWGDNNENELGTGGSSYEYSPAAVGGSNPKRWTAISSSGATTCAIRDNSKLSCWGAGPTGSGEPGGAQLPEQEARGFTDWKAVSAGSASCALRTNKQLYCWGRNDDGQLGTGAPLSEVRLSPILVK